MVHDEQTPQTLPAPPEADQLSPVARGAFSDIDLRRVRRYLRLAAVIQAFLIVTSPLLLAWLLIRFFDVDSGAVWIIIPTGLLIIGGVGFALISERRLRNYYVHLADDALVYEFGQSRTMLMLDQVQIVDQDASVLLRLCGLCRLSLHTAGGIVTMSPVPVEIPPMLEERIHHRPPAAPRAS